MDTFLAVLGIVISLVLFFIGYRQTVGAKKERIAACNAEIEKILLRRVVLEGYAPAQLDVERLMAGKARDFRVSSDDLLSTGQVLNTLYTRIVESDLIPAEERRTLVGRITPALVECESKPLEAALSEMTESRRGHSIAVTATTVMAVLASLVGAATTALPDLANFDTMQPGMYRTFAATAFVSLVLIAFFAVTYRIRNSQEQGSTKSGEIDHYLQFEKLVAANLKRSGFSVRPVPGEMAGDFLIERRGKKYLVEVKTWPRRMPSQLLKQLADKLSRTATELGAPEVLIVTQVPVLDASEVNEIPNVTILTQKQLAEFFEAKDRQNTA